MTRTTTIIGVAALFAATGCTTFTGVEDYEAEQSPAIEDDGGNAARYETPTVDRPITCAYPSGQFGVDEGMIVPSTISWNGYPATEAEPRVFDLSELYDCEGSKGYHAILVDTSQFG
ncbi:MAG: hypothetical protein R3B72_22235 [Polyangiaceae bacterium]